MAVTTTSSTQSRPVHMRKPDSNQEQGHPSAPMSNKGVANWDIEAQSFASQTTANAEEPEILPATNTSVSCCPPTLPSFVYATGSNTSTSITTPLEIECELPRQKHVPVLRSLRWTLLTIYHRLCLLVLVPNLIFIVTSAAQHNLFNIPLPDMATAVAVNIALAVLMRQELVINLLFALVAKCPRRAPLRIRRVLAKIYHLGGVHSGAGIAATVWFTFFNAALIWRWRTNSIPDLPPTNQIPIVVTFTIVIDMFLISIVVFAHPSLRRRSHNTFEFVHRFLGWMTVFLFWVDLFVLTGVLELAKESPRPLGAALLQSPALYLLIIVTVSLILPWLRLRKVPIRVEHLSNHASRWHFQHGNVELCSASRVTDRPLFEWHSFAGIPEHNGTGYSVIVSNAGDWTKRMIQNPPAKLWVRGIPVRGVLHIATIFQKIVVVATGSGIGPVLSLLTARDLPCRILWSARDPIHTYAKTIIDEVFVADPAALIFDTKAMDRNNRPDLLKLAYGLYKESNAEAVFVISNQKVTEKLVYGLESRGVPTFAPIFDS
ncbi:hypothetical protein GJ744_004330 [Endocarpon pusillum]|uniref:Nonribosomal peptide synthetase 12 n=1 Tax=Endocarpon pusillum TaxID=364733 RepID=A0A8H7E025_9EURO|nr:hypothetical protein GJ744_004330 [Endocarpon pusillum]